MQLKLSDRSEAHVARGVAGVKKLLEKRLESGESKKKERTKKAQVETHNNSENPFDPIPKVSSRKNENVILQGASGGRARVKKFG